MKKITILIPTYNRPVALATTLTSLIFQKYKDFDILIADQSQTPISHHPTIMTITHLLQEKNIQLHSRRNLPKKGISQQRQFLLDLTCTEYALFLDDDVILDDFAIKNMLATIEKEKCGFVGNAVVGLSYKNDHRPQEEKIEFWQNGVKPETVTPASDKWERHLLHNAANMLHVTEKRGITPDNPQPYKVAWVGGCTLYQAQKLRDSGGFSFWTDLPTGTVGEDAAAQVSVMKKYGGCAILPSGAYHQELPTTLQKRKINAPQHLYN